MAAPHVEEPVEVVKWYTRARRFPQLIGKTPDGARLWGGPYTYTQVVAGVAVLVVGMKTISWWGQFGLIGNAVTLLGATYAITVFLGHLPVGSRNPLAVGAGLIRAVSSPATGKCAGSPVRIRRPHRVASRVVINPPVATPMSPAAAAPSPQKDTRARVRMPRLLPAPPLAPSGGVPGLRPTPATAPRPAPPALTGVQRLLASTGADRQED